MVFCGLEDIYQCCKSSVVITIGNFDGVHKGHLHLLSVLRQQATKHQASSVVITFEPHPKKVLRPDILHYRLTLPDEKRWLIEKAGVDCYVEIPFTPQFSSIGYDKFLQTIIAQPLQLKALCLGKDHKFGREGEGTISKVNDFLKPYHVDIIEVEDITTNHQKVTSTAIREFILKGDIPSANQQLSADYSFRGTVVTGSSVGRTIGFPTANIIVSPEKILPPNGVYAVQVIVDNQSLKGMMNIGQRPTVTNENRTTIEVHIFDFNKNMYGRQLQIFPLRFIRPERKMQSLDELKEQLTKDRVMALQSW